MNRWRLCLLPLIIFFAACAPVKPTPPQSPQPTPAQTPSQSLIPTPSPPNAPGLMVHLISLTTDASGYRHATVEVTVLGPRQINPSFCGAPAPITLWAENAQGVRLPSDIIYPQYCQSVVIQSIPAGSTRTYSAATSWPASSRPVVLYGKLALAKGSIPLPVLAIPPS